MASVYAVSGSVKHLVARFPHIDDAFDFCIDSNWVYDWNGGLVWDLEVEED